MKLLIVDDQLATLKGLAREIDWEQIGITEVNAAQNAMEARLAFREGAPDIMLCDIEMPVENGIDLCRWVRAQEYQTKVIFLTCHSEFTYAQDAISLGAIDYILQPAPYEKILAVVHKAIMAVQEAGKQQEALVRAKAYAGKQDYICQKLWKDYLLHMCNLETMLETIAVPDTKGEFNLLLLQMVRWKQSKEDWEESLLSVILFSFFKDIFQEKYYVMLTPIIPDIYALIIQGKDGQAAEEEKLISQLQYLTSVFDMYMPCEYACYLAERDLLQCLPMRMEELNKKKERNLSDKAGIFTMSEAASESADKMILENSVIPFDTQILFWKEYIGQNRGDKMEQEARELLVQMERDGSLNVENLIHFHQAFMQMLYQAELEEGGKRVSTLFASDESSELYRSGMKSMEGMLDLIHYVALEQSHRDEAGQKDEVEIIKRYINNHLERNITKDEISEIVHLNSDYVTRLFKKETGMSIKSYIIQQKMIAARNLLQNTSFSVSHIAIRLGYSNFSHFAATYKKQFGIIPTEEKRNHHEKDS